MSNCMGDTYLLKNQILKHKPIRYKNMRSSLYQVNVSISLGYRNKFSCLYQVNVGISLS